MLLTKVSASRSTASLCQPIFWTHQVLTLSASTLRTRMWQIARDYITTKILRTRRFTFTLTWSLSSAIGSSLASISPALEPPSSFKSYLLKPIGKSSQMVRKLKHPNLWRSLKISWRRVDSLSYMPSMLVMRSCGCGISPSVLKSAPTSTTCALVSTPWSLITGKTPQLPCVSSCVRARVPLSTLT